MGYTITKAFKGVWDRVTRVPAQIDTDHVYIHEGAAFEVSNISTAGNAKYSFEPSSTGGSDKYIHFRPARIAIEDGDLTFGIWEGSTKDSTGDIVTAWNRNRTSSITNEWELKIGDTSTTPTSTGDYRKISEFKLWGGTGPGQTAIGSETGQPVEWVLKRNTKYVFDIATTADYSINFFWYEEDDG